jgi:hypothetical protein
LKILLNRNSLKPEEVVKIEMGTIGPIVLCEDDPNKAVYSFTPNMSRDIFKNAEDIFADLKVIIGYNRNQGGEFEQSRRTAEEIKTVRSVNQIRDDELRDIIADMLGDMFQNKIHPLLFQNWDNNRFVEVSSVPNVVQPPQVPGAPPQPPQPVEWVPFDGHGIRGDYDVEVIPDTVLPINKEQAKRESIELFQVLSQNPLIRQQALLKQLLDNYDNIRAEDLIKTPQEIQQEQKMEFQKQLILAQAKTQQAGTPQGQRPQGAPQVPGPTRPPQPGGAPRPIQAGRSNASPS